MAAAHTRKRDKLQFASLFQGTGCVAFDLLSTAFCQQYAQTDPSGHTNATLQD